MRRVAVVGCGYWGSNHVRALAQFDGLDVVPVDSRSGIAEACALQHRLGGWATDLADVVDGLDAVVLATPPSSHHALGLLALRAGCHLLVEKPITLDTGEADDLIATALSEDRTLAVGHTFLFSAPVVRLAEVVAGADFGAPLHISSERLNLGLYRDDVDVLWDLAPHDISILNYVLGSTPATVQCWATGHRARNNDIASLSLTYTEPDVTATVQVSWLHPEKVRRMTVVGENQMVQLDDTSPAEPIKIHDVAVRPIDAPGGVAYERSGVTIPVVEGAEPLRLELADFLDCCVSGAQPRTSGSMGRDVVGVLEAAARSMETGRPVHVEAPRPLGLRAVDVDLAVAKPDLHLVAQGVGG